MSRPQHHGPAVHLGGRPAVALFVVALIAFVAETQLTQYVQTDLGFRHPYFIFYIVHSSFYSLASLRTSIIVATQEHLAPKSILPSSGTPIFPTRKLVRLVFILTVGVSIPSLLWFVAVRLAPVTDVTALWNTNAFFAYVFTTVLTGAKWDTRRLAGVVIATAGALAVVYGGSAAEADKADTSDTSQSMSQSRAALVGDLMTLVGSIAYAAYQVYYKLRAALPNDPEVYAEHYAPLDDSADFLPDDEENQEDTALRAPDVDDVIRPLPFGLYPNLLTSLIGVCTLLVFWVPVPLLDAWGIVPFEMPRDAHTYLVIAGIAVTGSVFNAGFMVLLGVWGPIVTSVGSLFTIVLVFISDLVFGDAADTVTAWSVLGCSAIVLAFGVLAYDMVKGR